MTSLAEAESKYGHVVQTPAGKSSGSKGPLLSIGRRRS